MGFRAGNRQAPRHRDDTDRRDAEQREPSLVDDVRQLRRDPERGIAEQERHTDRRKQREAERIRGRIVIAAAAARAAAERRVRDQVCEREHDDGNAGPEPRPPRSRPVRQLERDPQRRQRERGLGAGERDREHQRCQPAVSRPAGCERRRRERTGEGDVTRRDPGVRVDVGGRQPEHRQRQRRRRRGKHPAKERHRRDEQRQVPGERDRVVAERVVAEHAIVGGKRQAGQRANKVELEVGRRPPRQMPGADTQMVPGPVAGHEAKQIVRRGRVDVRRVQLRTERMIVGHEPDPDRRRRDRHDHGDRDRDRPPTTRCAAGFSPSVVVDVADWASALALVGAGVGLTLVPQSSAAAPPPNVAIRKLPWLRVTSPLWLVRRRGSRSPLVDDVATWLLGAAPPSRRAAHRP